MAARMQRERGNKGERDGERETETERDRERQREIETGTERDRETETETERDRDRERRIQSIKTLHPKTRAWEEKTLTTPVAPAHAAVPGRHCLSIH
jgi:hypothetical protein